MSAWTHLCNFASAAIKRPMTCLLGILGVGATAAATAYVTNSLTTVGTFLSDKAAELSCQYRQKPIANESQFMILVSPLAHDPDRSHTERVMRAFLGEKGFLVVPICESLKIDYSRELQTATDDALQRARDLIKANHADLLLFGEVSERDKAVLIYAVNEHGGCDLRPKPTIIEHGDFPDDFTAEQKENLIAGSLQEIQSACLNQSSIDWPLFAKRMNKMEMFFKYFNLNQPKSLKFAELYIESTRLLYGNGQGDIWFSKGETFTKQIIEKYKGISKALSPIYTEYAILLYTRFDKTSGKDDQNAAFHSIDKAIDLDPNNAFAYRVRGDAYRKRGELDRAIEDYTKAIALYPKDAASFGFRGYVYSNKDDTDRAIEDYTKAIGLDPNNAFAYRFRGDAYGEKGELDLAIEDYTKAIGLDPKDAAAYYTRGNAYRIKGEFDRAIEDDTKAIALFTKDRDYYRSMAYGSRATAYLAKGDEKRWFADFRKGMELAGAALRR